MKNIRYKILEILTGKTDVIRHSFADIYSGEMLDVEVDRYKRKGIKKYLFLAMITGLVIIFLIPGSAFKDRCINSIIRPERGEGSITIPVVIKANYDDLEVSGNANVRISERRLTENEIETELKGCVKRIKNIVPKNKRGIRIIYEDIDLPTKDKKTGAEIRWTSSDSKLVTEEGKVDVLALSGQSEDITLTADISFEGINRREDIILKVVKDPKMYESSIKNEIEELLNNIDSDGSKNTVILPKKLSEGVELRWMTKADRKIAIVAFMSISCMAGLYFRRYSNMRKKIRKYKEDITENFPYIVDKLVLLLNSGLTLFSALMKLSDDAMSKKKKTPVLTELSNIGIRVRETNSSLLDEWKDFAVRMGSSDMLRFVSLLEENHKKGGELVGKLESEGEIMREMQKKNVQQRIRMIDSKMTVPMMIMLMSLIIVTVTPSIMQI